METAPVLLGERLEDCTEALLRLAEGEFLLRIEAWAWLLGQGALVDEVALSRLICSAPLQSQIMGNSKEPAIEVCTRAAELQMPEESEKCLLHDIFGIVKRKTAVEYVT